MRLATFSRKRSRGFGRDPGDRKTSDFVALAEKEQVSQLDQELRNDLNAMLRENRSALLDEEDDLGFDDVVRDFFRANEARFSKLFSLIETSSIFLSEFNSSDYDKVVNVSDYWANLAALAQFYVPLPRFANDNRRGTLCRIEDSNRRRIKGRVISTSMQKTVVVEVEQRQRDRLTGKTVSKRKKYQVHDEYEECKIGDLVVAIEGRPLSKKKRHSLLSKARA